MKPVQFTPAQLRETVGISVETFRHWKRVLPPFASRQRYIPSFTIGDLLAARILRRLTEDCGIRVGHLTTVSNEIVRVCNTAAWAWLEDKTLVIDLVKGTCRISKGNDEGATADIIIRCAMNPIMRELRDALLRSPPSADQRSLFFPPVEVRREARVRRRAT
jgi:hypothetical protein